MYKCVCFSHIAACAEDRGYAKVAKSSCFAVDSSDDSLSKGIQAHLRCLFTLFWDGICDLKGQLNLNKRLAVV